MYNSEITQTEFDFIVEIRDNAGVLEYETLKLYTMPYITAKLKWQLDKLFMPALQTQLIKNISNEKMLDLLTQSGVDLSKISNEADLSKHSAIIDEYRTIMLQEYSKKPLEALNDDYDKAVEFCLLCIDRQRILREENGREKLDKILDTNYWELQKPELLRAIIGQYSPSDDAVA